MELKPLTHKDAWAILELIQDTMPSVYEVAKATLTDKASWKKHNRKMWGAWGEYKNGGIYKEHSKYLVYCCGLYDDEYISWFAVSPEAQGRGVGTDMLNFLISQCKCDTLYVETYLRQEFTSANAFYLKNGFTLYSIALPDVIYYQKDISKR